MKYTSSVLAAIAVMVALPASSIAATYAYVSVNGTLAYVEATSATQALTLPTDRMERSGVILLTPAVQARLFGAPVQATTTMPAPMVIAPVATTTATSTMVMPAPVVATSTATTSASASVATSTSVTATSTATTTSVQ
ncbi:MAG: hypothetical protein M3Q63_03500 [bacterium]|nr:hypothetical protein [bacterium]